MSGFLQHDAAAGGYEEIVQKLLANQAEAGEPMGSQEWEYSLCLVKWEARKRNIRCVWSNGTPGRGIFVVLGPTNHDAEAGERTRPNESGIHFRSRR